MLLKIKDRTANINAGDFSVFLPLKRRSPTLISMVGMDGHLKSLEELEREAICMALRFYRGRISEAARRLGIGRSTLYRRIEALGIEVD